MGNRSRRGALWALGLAGAAYLWRNRDRVQQQMGRFNRGGTQRQLPDYESNRDPMLSDRGSQWSQSGERQPGAAEF